ncbi:OsmC family protein [Pontiellaceae bacterium B1224]|nr:OsmC family protein [Pontiellaceae bacterium B1224]
MNTMTSEKKTNGIDTTTQQQIIAMLTEQPNLAKVTFKTSNDWKGGTVVRSTFNNYAAAGQEHEHAKIHEVTADMPGVFLGGDKAPTPAEYALHALASCMNSSMVYNAAARGITVHSSNVRIEGILDARGFLHISKEVPTGYQEIRAVFEVDADAPAEAIQELIEAAPMLDVFTRAIPVSLNLQMK